MGKIEVAEQYETILLAAGSAKRFDHPDQRNKILLPLGQRPVFDHSLRLFVNDPSCLKIWFVVNPRDESRIKKYIRELYKETPDKISWVCGGKERQDSVSCALNRVTCEMDKKVLIHDAARPFVTEELIERLVEAGKQSVAVTLGIPATDSMKRVRDSKVTESLYRPEVWHIQTPQLFDCSVLKKAVHKAEEEKFYGNEEAELVERAGHPVTVALGSKYNFKLTTSFDYQVAKMLEETPNGHSPE